jgi:hypothetical protein
MEGELGPLRQRSIGVGKQQIGEREVDRRLLERHLQRRLEGRRHLGDGDQVLGRRQGNHRLAVEIELGSGTVALIDDPQAVGSLHRDIVARREHQGRTETAGMLVADRGGEGHRPGRRQPGAGGLEQVDGARLEGRLVDRRRLFLGRRLGTGRRHLRANAGYGENAQGQGDPGLANEIPGRKFHGIIPHSNILLTMGPDTLSKKTFRICGSSRRNCMTRCSSADFGSLFFCHNSSQLAAWYFWTTRLATASRIGYWA